jgi:hypothetical protein
MVNHTMIVLLIPRFIAFYDLWIFFATSFEHINHMISVDSEVSELLGRNFKGQE